VLDGLEGSLRLIEQSWVQTNKSDNSSYCKNLLKNTWGEERKKLPFAFFSIREIWNLE